MESPTGLIPEHLMERGMKPAVLNFLRAQAWPAHFKLQVLAGWAQVTGCIVGGDEQHSVEQSGWE